MNAINNKHIEALTCVLGRMERHYNELTVTVEAKIKAMRSAHMEELHAVKDREHKLLRTVSEQEGLRRQLMDKIGVSLGMPPKTARVMTVSQLCGRLDRCQSQAVHAAADGLRRAVAETARTNRIAGTIARELVNHLKWVWSAARPAGAQSSYNRAGAGEATVDLRIFDAMG